MRPALHAEWTKLRTVPAPAWLVLAAAVATVALGALASRAVTCEPGCGLDATKISLTGLQLGQAVVAVLAVLAVGDEYRTGMIRTTLTAVPARSTLLAAKAAVVAGAVLAAGALGVGGAIVAGRLILPGQGFADLPATDGATLRAAVGSVLYLVLIALLSLGVATLVRDAATAVGTVLGLLYLLPVLLMVISDPDWQRRLRQLTPTEAGQAISHTVGVDTLPIGPWPGLGILALWALAALLAGATLLHHRDA